MPDAAQSAPTSSPLQAVARSGGVVRAKCTGRGGKAMGTPRLPSGKLIYSSEPGFSRADAESSDNNTTFQATPSKATTSQAASFKAASYKATPSQGTPIKATPSKATTFKATSSEATPSKAATSQSTLSITATSQANPSMATPAKASAPAAANGQQQKERGESVASSSSGEQVDIGQASASKKPQAKESPEELNQNENNSRDNEETDEKPSQASLALLRDNFSKPVSQQTKDLIMKNGAQAGNAWLTAITGHHTSKGGGGGGGAVASNKYDCLVLCNLSREHGKFRHIDLLEFAPAALNTYLASIDKQVKPRPDADPTGLWYIESHRLQFIEGKTEEDNAEEEVGEWYVELSCVSNAGISKWVVETEVQQQHPSAALTYWATSKEGVATWLDFNDDARTLADGEGQQRQVAHRICKIIAHSTNAAADANNNKNKNGNDEGSDSAKASPRPPKKGQAVRKAPALLGKRKRDEEITRYTFICQWTGFPAGKWTTHESGARLKEVAPRLYREYVKRMITKS